MSRRRHEARERAAADTRVLDNLDLHQVLECRGGVFVKDSAQSQTGRYFFGEKGSRTHKIQVNGSLWQCFVLERGGRGAISLTQELGHPDFRDAREWLRQNFYPEMRALKSSLATQVGTDRSASRVQKSTDLEPDEHDPGAANIAVKRELVTPGRDDDRGWKEVRAALIKRGLAPRVLDSEFDAGNIYATRHEVKKYDQVTKIPNAVFVMRDSRGRPVGYDIKGIHRPKQRRTFSMISPGSSKKTGAVLFGCDLTGAEIIGVAESSIDALAALSLITDERCKNEPWYVGAKKIAMISTGGSGGIPEAIVEAFPRSAQLHGYQDNDPSGHDKYAKISQSIPGEWLRQVCFSHTFKGKEVKDWADLSELFFEKWRSKEREVTLSG